MARRIQTEINEEHLRGGKDSAVKRINISGRPPLADNKTLLNDPKKGVDALRQSDMKNNFSSSSIKASTRIKSILANNNANTGLVGTTEKKREGPSRPLQTMVTEPYEKPSKPSTAGQQRTTDSMVQRLFNKDSKKTSSVKEEKSTILAKKEPISPASKYVFEEVVGSGTFGVVYKGRNKDTLDVVAIKKVLQDKKYKNREFEILKQLHHVNVLKMKEAFFTQDGQQEFLNVIMDYFPDTVYSVIKNYNRKRVMPDPLLKIYAYQLFRSLLYLNKISICHRDIKPHNILIDQRSNQLVMCDFGSAKKLVKGEPNIAYICSRCYRAPELIFGATDYTTQIDMWSAGCVLVEMIICEPLFIASNNIDQLVEIIRVLGTPTVDEVLAMNPQYDMSQFRFPKINAREWRKVLLTFNSGR